MMSTIKNNVTAYKFNPSSTAPEPKDTMTELFYKLKAGGELTREEKNQVVNGLYGMGGTRTHIYKRAGWAFDFSSLLKRFIINSHDHWQVYYSPDKTSLRKCNWVGPIHEIHEIGKLKNHN